MPKRNTLVRSMHDLGLAAWFGGALMGAVGLNGAASEAKDPTERLSLSSAGWAKWAPVQLGALVVHGIGGVGLILSNKARLAGQPEARTNTVVKVIVTALAGGSALYSGILGTQIAEHASEGGDAVTKPGPGASEELAAAQKQQNILQWVTPVLTGILLILAAQQGEQQRPVAGLLRSRARKLTGR
ncbi:hypothetical protein IWX81_002110 [Salinibacterium sp. CAN_S4]|uniref:hypothetical protein n=1 Tax=Salinibacterium sp. CAN_S4 TaxID=2787727 RepID=UPI0018EF837C